MFLLLKAFNLSLLEVSHEPSKGSRNQLQAKQLPTTILIKIRWHHRPHSSSSCNLLLRENFNCQEHEFNKTNIVFQRSKIPKFMTSTSKFVPPKLSASFWSLGNLKSARLKLKVFLIFNVIGWLKGTTTPLGIVLHAAKGDFKL